jgi:undecaprenyl pyrophosphate phosphatase UppP
MKTKRRMSIVVGTTVAAVVLGVVGVLVYDLIVGGVNRPLVTAIVVVMALIVGPLIGLFLDAPMEDGEADEAARQRAPSRR